VNGLLIPLEDVNAAKEAILRLYHDRQLSERLGNQGREYVVRNLQWKDTVSKVDALYKIDEGKPARPITAPTAPQDLKKLSLELALKDQKRWQDRYKLEPTWMKTVNTLLDPISGAVKKVGPRP